MSKGTKEKRTTKYELVQAVYTKLGGFSKKESADLVDLIFELMKETLGRGETIKISGFGNFVLRDKRERQGRNPQTGEPITISSRRVLTFKPSQLLKQALNSEDGAEDGGMGAPPGTAPPAAVPPAAVPPAAGPPTE
jgi:integration host factor subunit alpha